MTTELIKTQAYIDGAWVDAQSDQTFSVTNPSTDDVIAHVPDMDGSDTRSAINAAHTAFEGWRKTTARERSSLLRRWFELITEQRESLARLLTLEQGKPLSEARNEVTYGASFVEWFSEEAPRAYGDIIPSPMAGSRISVLKQPVGVCAAITPWNFPIAMITRKVAPALAAGCTMIVKPAEQTPLSALALASLADHAGFPKGVLNIITAARGDRVGGELCENPLIRKISFTGSTKTGRHLLGLSAATVKKVSLELGGNAPFIVFDDANIDNAVSGAIASKFRNSGQTCVCPNRFFVQETIYEPFIERLKLAVEKLRVGDGLDPGVDQGPLINLVAVQNTENLIRNAVDAGATTICGGNRHKRGGTFFNPTIISGATDEMAIMREEIFGPSRGSLEVLRTRRSYHACECF